jgi:mono/diheme cytochrome c family protein
VTQRLPLITPLFLVLLAACTGMSEVAPSASKAAANNGLPPPLPAEQISHGKAVYDLHCASCHGADMAGESNWKQQNEDGSFRAPPHTADGHTWHHADSVLLEAIREGGARFEGAGIGGSSAMPAFARILTEEEIDAVLTYIKSTWPADVRALQWQQTRQDMTQ